MERDRRPHPERRDRREPERDVAPPQPAEAVLALQRGAGNAAVTRALQSPTLQRAPSAAPLSGVRLNHDRVSLPLPAGVSLRATAVPGNAAGVSFRLEDGSAPVDATTTIDATTGAITIGAGQEAGSINVVGQDSGAFASRPLNLVGPPSDIDTTSSADASGARTYAGDFTHTFSAAGGDAGDLERARVNERFIGVPNPGGTSHDVAVPFGTFTLESNSQSSTAGWSVDASGTMGGPDTVGISRGLVRVAPFVQNASNPSPAQGLPVEFSLRQGLHFFTFPAGGWSAQPFKEVPHVRRLQESAGSLEVVISVNGEELTLDYTGPPAFLNARATPDTVDASEPAPPRSRGAPPVAAPTPNTVQIECDSLPSMLPTGHELRFSIEGRARGCRIDRRTGLLTIGTQAGTVRVRCRDSVTSNGSFDEVTVTITPRPAATPAPPATGAGAGADGPQGALGTGDEGDEALA